MELEANWGNSSITWGLWEGGKRAENRRGRGSWAEKLEGSK